MISILATALAVVLVQADRQQPPPKPAPAMDQLKFLAGTWKCAAKDFATALGPERAAEATWTFKLDGDGFWYSFRGDEKKTKNNPNPQKSAGLFGWDPVAKKIVGYIVDSAGDSLVLTSPGWEGDKLVWIAEAGDKAHPITFRTTIVKTGEREFTRLGEFSMKPNEWTKGGEGTCKR